MTSMDDPETAELVRENLALEAGADDRFRTMRSVAWTTFTALATALAIAPLASILVFVVVRGAPSLSLRFFTELPGPIGAPTVGMGNAIAGSLVIVALACAIGLPIGIGTGIYLAEFGRGAFAKTVRFVAEVLAGVPSITLGVFVYSVLVISMKRFSAIAGASALALVMLPSVARSTEELLRLVPGHLREASLALGIPAWRTTLFVVLRTAAPAVGTSVLLAIGRVAGETAPLLFTSFNEHAWSTSVDRPMASLPVQILTYATSPYEEWRRQAWTGALVLVAGVFLMNITARAIAAKRAHGGSGSP